MCPCVLTKLGNLEDNLYLCRALDSIEFCYDITKMLVEKVSKIKQPNQAEPQCRPILPNIAEVDNSTGCDVAPIIPPGGAVVIQAERKTKIYEKLNIQPSLQPRRTGKKEENEEGKTSRKRKMCEVSRNQPSLQPRRRRKKEEESTELSKLDEVVYMDVDEKKFIWEKKFNFKPSKVNTSEGGNDLIAKNIPTSKGGKRNLTRKRRLQIPSQKSRITNFFKPIQTTGLVAVVEGGVEKLETSSSTQLNFEGRVITSGVGSGGRECRSGLAVGVGVDGQY